MIKNLQKSIKQRENQNKKNKETKIHRTRKKLQNSQKKNV